MKIVVCVAPAFADSYGHLTRYAEQLALAGVQRDISVEILKFPSPEFFPRLFANLADENCVVHFYGYLYDLRIMTSAAPGGCMHVLDGARAKTVATVGDHPFSPFMQVVISNAHPSTRFVVMDQDFPEEMQVLNPALKSSRYDYRPIAPPTNYDEALLTSYKDRSFDLVVPMHLTDMSANGIDFILSKIHVDWLRNAALSCYSRALEDINTSPMRIFVACLQDELGTITLDQIREHNAQFIPEIFTIIAAVDALVRQTRRQRMVASLLRSVGKLKVVVTCDPIPSLRVDDNVTFIGKRPVEEVVTMMARSRAILNCNPSYPTGLHERVISGMMYKSCVITDLNPYISETFSAQEFVPYAPDAVMSLPDIFANCDVEAVAAAGGGKIRNDPAFSWNAHIDGLLQAAA
jgi:hypothetical protein